MAGSVDRMGKRGIIAARRFRSRRIPGIRRLFRAGEPNHFADVGIAPQAVISTSAHRPARCRIYKGQKFTKDDQVWAFGNDPNPYQPEWDHLIDAIRQNKPHNEAKRGAEAMAAHTGR